MTTATLAATKPVARPERAYFSSGPCAKRPGWTPQALDNAFLARSHRAKEGKARLKLAIDKTKAILGLPADTLCAIVPGSDTGAFEMAMWSMLGQRGVDALAWESFGKGWVNDAVKQLELKDVRVLEAPYGALPDLTQVDFNRDVLFTSNGTTSGVRVPNYDWIPHDRAGLTFADATSGAFAQAIDWSKIDVGTFSWQKALGGEAAHGMLVLSPRAVQRLESYVPAWPLPKVFRTLPVASSSRASSKARRSTRHRCCAWKIISTRSPGPKASAGSPASWRALTPMPACCSIGSRSRHGSPISQPIPRPAPTRACA